MLIIFPDRQMVQTNFITRFWLIVYICVYIFAYIFLSRYPYCCESSTICIVASPPHPVRVCSYIALLPLSVMSRAIPPPAPHFCVQPSPFVPPASALLSQVLHVSWPFFTYPCKSNRTLRAYSFAYAAYRCVNVASGGRIRVFIRFGSSSLLQLSETICH